LSKYALKAAAKEQSNK